MLQIIQSYVLEVDFKQFGDRLLIVVNLPYNISSPRLFHLLQYVDQVQDQHFMLQKEMVERMAAQPGSRHYFRLSVMLQAKNSIMPQFYVPPESFHSHPNIMSTDVQLR